MVNITRANDFGVFFRVSFLLLLACRASANTEKVIFVTPSPLFMPNFSPGLDDLRLTVLSPLKHSTVRTQLSVIFPTDSEPHGLESWFLVRGLKEGQRNEIRVCWAATQPTNFWLDVYPVNEVLETPDLISSLASYSESVQDTGPTPPPPSQRETDADKSLTTLLLRVQSAADFFTLNNTLMQHPPPVVVDIILDPYLFNVLPSSLSLTVPYIVALAIVGWYSSKFILSWISRIQSEDKEHTE